jgi:hypothetical protein
MVVAAVVEPVELEVILHLQMRVVLVEQDLLLGQVTVQ